MHSLLTWWDCTGITHALVPGSILGIISWASENSKPVRDPGELLLSARQLAMSILVSILSDSGRNKSISKDIVAEDKIIKGDFSKVRFKEFQKCFHQYCYVDCGNFLMVIISNMCPTSL